MKVFTCQKGMFIIVAVAYNRGHAVKMIAKDLEKMNIKLEKTDSVKELNLETKGEVHIYRGTNA